MNDNRKLWLDVVGLIMIIFMLFLIFLVLLGWTEEINELNEKYMNYTDCIKVMNQMRIIDLSHMNSTGYNISVSP